MWDTHTPNSVGTSSFVQLVPIRLFAVLLLSTSIFYFGGKGSSRIIIIFKRVHRVRWPWSKTYLRGGGQWPLAVRKVALPGELVCGKLMIAAVAALKDIYTDSAVTVLLHKESKTIRIKRGVRQGDTISPKLFTATLVSIFRRLTWENKGVNNRRRISLQSPLC